LFENDTLPIIFRYRFITLDETFDWNYGLVKLMNSNYLATIFNYSFDFNNFTLNEQNMTIQNQWLVINSTLCYLIDSINVNITRTIKCNNSFEGYCNQRCLDENCIVSCLCDNQCNSQNLPCNPDYDLLINTSIGISLDDLKINIDSINLIHSNISLKQSNLLLQNLNITNSLLYINVDSNITTQCLFIENSTLIFDLKGKK